MTTAIGPSLVRLPTSSPTTTKPKNTQSKEIKSTNQYKISWTCPGQTIWISIAGQVTPNVQVDDDMYE